MEKIKSLHIDNDTYWLPKPVFIEDDDTDVRILYKIIAQCFCEKEEK